MTDRDRQKLTLLSNGEFVDTKVTSNRVFRHMCPFPRWHVLDVGGIGCRGVPAGGKRVDKHRESSGLDVAHH